MNTLQFLSAALNKGFTVRKKSGLLVAVKSAVSVDIQLTLNATSVTIQKAITGEHLPVRITKDIPLNQFNFARV